MLEIDIWDNVTYYVNKEIWYKQTFIEDELICYEDYLGNYWTKDFGEFKFPKVKYEWLVLGNKWWEETRLTLGASTENTVIKVSRKYLLIKGESHLETGYVYAPHIPLIMTPHSNSDSLHITSGITTNYATKTINTSYYGTVTVINPDTTISI